MSQIGCFGMCLGSWFGGFSRWACFTVFGSDPNMRLMVPYDMRPWLFAALTSPDLARVIDFAALLVDADEGS